MIVQKEQRQPLGFSGFVCCEGEGDDHFILGNGYVGQVWRLDPEIRHIDGAGRRSRYRLPNYLSLHVKDLFVGFAMHRQVAGQLKMNSLPVSIARR